MFKVKRDLADKLWSEYIRKRDKVCKICGTDRNLTCSHYHSRRKESVRYHEWNTDALCISCHMKYEHEKGFTEGIVNGEKISLPKKYTAWKMKQLGENKYNQLLLIANKTHKKDRAMEVIRIKQLLKQTK